MQDGSERRGAIESVERLVRTTVRMAALVVASLIIRLSQLRSMQPPVHIPRTPKRRMHDGWAMVDAGDFAVHILSRTVRERYFAGREW